MKVRMVTWEPATGLFVVSIPMAFEEMEAFAGRAKASAAELVSRGELEIVTAADLPGLLFPSGEKGMLVTMFLSQAELNEKREGMGRLFSFGRPRKPKRRR